MVDCLYSLFLFLTAFPTIRGSTPKAGASPFNGQLFRRVSERFHSHFSSTKRVHAGGTKLASHTHPMPNIAYVHSGSLTVKSETDNREQQLKHGDFLAEMVNKPHYGYTGSEAVELYVVYCGVTGQELAINTP